MKFDILGLMQNKMVLDALKKAPISGMDDVFAKRVTDNVMQALTGGTNRDFESACTVLGASVFTLSPDNPFPLSPLQKVSAEKALDAAARNVYGILLKTFNHDWQVERMFKEEGDFKGSLVGVTDPNLIIQNIVAHYAEEAAKRSPFRPYLFGNDDDDRYNTQAGGSGVSVIIDFTKKKVAPVEGLIQTTVGEYTINVESTRDSLALTGLPGMDANEVTIIDNTPDVGAIGTVTGTDGKPTLCIRWPNARYGEINAKGKIVPREALKSEDIISEKAFVQGKDLTETDTEGDHTLNLYIQTRYGFVPKKGDVFVATRKMLHERITDMTNNPNSELFIAPAFLQDMRMREVKDDAGNITQVPCLAITDIKSVYEPKDSTQIGLEGQDVMNNHWKHLIVLFNAQHGGEGVQQVIDVNAKASDGTITLPATREACQVGSGNRYKCVICGKEVKKNGLKQFKPQNLPEGMDSNFPGLDDSEKYKNSWMCGTCCDSLVKQREAAVKAFKANKAELDKTKAEEEALIKEGIDAEDMLNKAKELVNKTEADAETVRVALKVDAIPEHYAAAIEDAKYNLQQAEARYHNVSVRLGLADNKSKALSNGSATVTHPPKPAAIKAANKNNTKPIGTNLGDAMKATANQAKVVSKPVGGKPLNAKERRREERRAAKLLGKS